MNLDAPPRPSVPALAWFAAAVWGGVVSAESCVWAAHAGAGVRAALLGAGAVLVAAAAACVQRASRRGVTLVLAGLALGGALSGVYGRAWTRTAALVRDAGAREWSGEVVGDPVDGPRGASVQVRLGGGPGSEWLVTVGWPKGERVPEMGERAVFRAVLKPRKVESPAARRRMRAGEVGVGTAWRASAEAGGRGWRAAVLRLRGRTREALDGVPGPGGDLMCGVLLGDRRRVADTAVASDFRSLGLAHLVAVSGDHLAIAVAAVALLARLVGLPRRGQAAFAVCGGAAFAVLTGWQMSAVRALAMLAAGTAAGVAGRRTDALAALSLASLVVLTERPWAAFDLGLQLSVLAVAGLALLGGLSGAWTAAALGRGRIAEAVGMTLAAQAATAPVAVPAFGMFSLAAPLANAAVVPLVAAGLVLGLVAAVCGWVVPAVAVPALWLAAWPMRAAAWVAALLGGAPGVAVPVDVPVTAMALATAAAGAALWWRWPAPERAKARLAGAALVVASLLAGAGPPVTGASVTMLDVGQGDAILVRDGPRTMLVDAGPDGRSLMKALGRQGVRRLDALVLTHPHDDHTGGLGAMDGVVDVGWTGVSAAAPEAAPWGSDADPGAASSGGLVRELVAGDSWWLGRTRVTVLWPAADARPENTNDSSVVLHVQRGTFDAVLTGDAEAAVQTAIARAGASGPAEVLKVPHHGSINGLSAEGLALWAPRVALVSVGERNRFGHPSPAVMRMLSESGARVWRTDLDGDVTVGIAGDGFEVRTSGRSAREAGRPGARACARIAGVGPATRARAGRAEGAHGDGRPEGSQSGLPHPRLGGVAPRAGRGPPHIAPGEDGRDRPQHARVRRRGRDRRRDPQRRQHAAVHV